MLSDENFPPRKRKNGDLGFMNEKLRGESSEKCYV